jgi:MYXO-CTERM domain-containing protein
VSPASAVHRGRLLAWQALAVAAALTLLPAAHAFSSIPPGRSPHERITVEAAEAAGFPGEATDDLRRAVVAPDFEEMELEPKADAPSRVDARAAYRAEHHCDRVPPAGDAEAFNATAAYVRSAMAEAWAWSAAGKPGDAVAWLGRALHAAQDCASHTDAVDRDQDDAFVAAALGKGPPLAGLRLTGFAPNTDDPETPKGDPYPHGAYAKDSADGTDESSARLPDNRTKYDAAYGLAVRISSELLSEWLAGIDAGQRARLAEAEHGGTPLPDVDVPSPPTGAAAAVLLALALATRRRAP